MTGRRLALLAVMGLLASCASEEGGDMRPVLPDAEPVDVGVDAGMFDAEPDVGPPDPGEPPDSGAFPDAEPIDAGPDAGVLATCPEPGNFPDGQPECDAAADCLDDIAPQSNCDYCRPYNQALCLVGRCATPPLLELQEGVFMRLSVEGLDGELRSFAGAVVTATTSGGATLTCDDVYAPSWDIDEPCYNRVDSRFAPNLGQPGQSFPFRFGGFPGGRRVLLVVFAFRRDNAAGDPIGISCTEVDVPPAGTRTEDLMITGDPMRRIE